MSAKAKIIRKPDSKWDDPEFRKIIRRMWIDEKASYSAIADATGQTRAMIAGGVRRMKLPMRSPKPFVPKVRKPTPYEKVDKLVRLVSTTQITDIRSREDDPIPVLLDGKPITVANVGPRHCRWPVSGNGLTMQFCGHTQKGEGSYCEKHLLRLVNPEASERFRKAWGLAS